MRVPIAALDSKHIRVPLIVKKQYVNNAVADGVAFHPPKLHLVKNGGISGSNTEADQSEEISELVGISHPNPSLTRFFPKAG